MQRHKQGAYTAGVHDVLGWLSLREWLAILRIGIGLWWLEGVRHKNLREFLRGSSMNWVEKLTRDHPVPAYAALVRRSSLGSQRSRLVTSYLIVTGESCVGVSLALGLLTVLGAIVGLFRKPDAERAVAILVWQRIEVI